jgi:phage recombination protein Bet
MSTATANATVAARQNGQQQTALAMEERSVTYVPIGEKEEIVLSVKQVENFLCVKTRSGKIACREDIIKFMMLCKAQGLNPWVNDAYLVGYDTNDGPKFQLIPAHQALLKRAELSKEYDGMESGVCVIDANGNMTERQGDLVLKNETLVGGWARVYRRDRKVPSYDSLKLETFSTGKSRWSIDPAGQICKCAEASALRKAFPSTLAQMYCREEMEREIESGHRERITYGDASQPHQPATKSEAIAAMLQKRIAPPETTTVEQKEPEHIEERPSTLELISEFAAKNGLSTGEGEMSDTYGEWRLPNGKLLIVATPERAPKPEESIEVVFSTDVDALVQVENIFKNCIKHRG